MSKLDRNKEFSTQDDPYDIVKSAAGRDKAHHNESKRRINTASDNLNNSHATLRPTRKKVTVSLALDSDIVQEIRKQAEKMEQSFNSRVNAILQKYLRFFILAEQDRAVIMMHGTHQFFIDQIDEREYTEELKRLAVNVVTPFFLSTGLANNLDNVTSFVFEGLFGNGGSVRSVKKFKSEEDGSTRLYFTHDYDLKWSRILSNAFAYLIHSLLHYHAVIRVFPEGFEIKILDRISE